MVVEADIRDYLAQNLDILEPGLTLIKKEKYLPNDEGSSGFVDIFCKDSANRLLIVEIKKSDAASRQAIHELSKYVALLKKNKLLRDSEIRLAVVSTQWHELSVPFSEFLRTSPYDCVGYSIEVRESGEITAISEIERTSQALVRRISPRQHIWEMVGADEPRNRIPALASALKNAGLEDFVLLDVSLRSEVDGIGGLIYFAQQEHSLKYYMERIEKNLSKGELEEFLEWISDLTEESDKVGEAADRVWGGCGAYEAVRPRGQQISYPERAMHWLSNERAAKIEVHRYGRFADDNIDDETIVSEICGQAGTSSYHLDRVVDLNSKPQVAELKDAMAEVLYANEQWKSQLGALVDYAQKNAYETVHVRCFNNDDILKSIAGIAVGQLGYVPNLEVTISKQDETHTFYGLLEWNGAKPNFGELVQSYFSGDPFMILMFEHFGENRSINDEILAELGMSFVLVMLDDDQKPVKVRFRGMSMNIATKPLGKNIFDFASEVREFVSELASCFVNHSTEFSGYVEALQDAKTLRDCENDLIEEFAISEEPTSSKRWAGELPVCQLCDRPFSQCRLMIDGAVGQSGPWANYCAACFKEVGQGVGLGKGQLYARNGGTWFLVAGS
ncbi:endonuclease NucS domain-containing protein [Actibacterium sp. XHP0104]|uniref:endonuclease NucS domain-containing protein n=1 Tax=Actibacterium sp. XHP0104 TaxID=2984335 RepID=UPI0021E8DBDD|nr:endonuclease NucS domain-containing protein [Actibacterium sp. XHP0104]MCV2882164.1 endonuclease NucS [Actibacterium sp. XHP0104]